jgi:NADPH2:quinone reductase
MLAIRVHEFGGPEVLRLEETRPPAPRPEQIVVAVKAAGVNPIDTYLRAGTHYRPELPFTPGRDAAGTVASVGRDVQGFKTGDRVYLSGECSGTYAGLVVCRQGDVHPLPAGVGFEQGAALGVPYTTAHRALFGKAKAALGETVLVHGASGGVGLAAVQWGRAAGLRVLGTAGSPKGLELVRKEGAHEVFDHRQPDCFDRILSATGGHGPDAIIEMLADVNLGRDLSLAARFGRIVVVGCRGMVEINPRDAMSKDVSILGMMVMNTPASELDAIHRELQEGLLKGTLRPVIACALPLAEAAEAHRAVLEPGACGKIVLLP